MRSHPSGIKVQVQILPARPENSLTYVLLLNKIGYLPSSDIIEWFPEKLGTTPDVLISNALLLTLEKLEGKRE